MRWWWCSGTCLEALVPRLLLPPRPSTQILDGPCCARPGSCGTLRTALGGGGTADGTADGGAAADLCNTGRNLCDPEGHLLHLALVQEVLPRPAVCVALYCFA
jgi:hypothetical protein